MRYLAIIKTISFRISVNDKYNSFYREFRINIVNKHKEHFRKFFRNKFGINNLSRKTKLFCRNKF